MALIPEEDITRVREATDIVSVVSDYVPLRPRGRDLWGCCPFHNEKTPSFKVSPQTQTWHCFGCGKGGDVFKFMMLKEQLNFPEAVKFLADKAHITITEESGGMPSGYRSRLLEVCKETAEFYHMQLMRGKYDGAANARQYLASRKLGGSIPKKWNLGYAPGSNTLTRYLRSKGFSNKEMIDANVALSSDRGGLRDRFYNRVMFPIRDLQGRTIAFGGRVIGKGEPKYINTSNCPLFSKRNNMFGIDFAKSSIVAKGGAIVVEGYTDVIAMHESGFENAVATLGTALTPQHVRMLTRFTNKIIYLFDGDAAGQNAADRASELITASVAPESGTRQVSLFVAVIPNNMDPLEYIDAAGGQKMQELLDNAEPLMRFVLDRRIASYDLSTPEGRAMALPKVLEPLVPIRDSILADEYVNYIADVFRLDFERVKKELQTAEGPRNFVNPDDVDSYTYDGQINGGFSNAPAGQTSAQGRSNGRQAAGPDHANGHDYYSEYQNQVPAFKVPASGPSRWESQLLCVYALRPDLRMRIAQDMRGQKWQNQLFESLFAIITKMPMEAYPSEVVSACMREHPESEPIWSIPVNIVDDSAQADQMVRTMLKERQKSLLEDEIANLEHDVKYGNLPEDQSNEIFARISVLQKELGELRRP